MNLIQKIKQHSVAQNALALVLLQVSNYAIPLLLLPFLTRTLGVEAFGIVAITLAVSQFAYVLTDYGFSLSATYGISKNRGNQQYINDKVDAIFCSKLILFLISAAIISLIPWLIPEYHNYKLYFILILIAVFFQAYQPFWFFQGIERMKNITIYSVLTKLLYAFLVLSFIRAPEDAIYVILFWGLSHAVGTICAMYFLFKEGYSFNVPTLSAIKSELKEGLEFFWSRLSVAIYSSLSTVIVGTSGALQASLYSIPEQIYKAGQNVTSPISTAMFPYMARHKDWKLFFRVFFISLAVLISGSVIIAAFAEYILVFLFGPEFRSATPILYVFIITVNISYIAVTFGYSAFSALNRNDIANKSVMYGALIHIVMLTILMANNISALKVAITVLLTETIVMSIRVYFFIKLRKKQYE
ncbi:TPA: oligosaccharide flippase family protein [Morganella morganii]|nr:oligosaccharide flippase family protein [Morganella morganii]